MPTPLRAVLCVGPLVLLASCARVSPTTAVVAPTPLRPAVTATASVGVTARIAEGSSTAKHLIQPEDVAKAVASVFGDTAALHPSQALLESSEPVWDIDVRSYETRERVMYYVQYFSTQARVHFQDKLSRGSRYQPMIRTKLRASGMPEDLTYLALIESGYDRDAYSKAAAVGMWQFMTRTAREVGLRVDWWIDERRDPAKSTDGAIRFLSDLQQQFGSLYLAAAAYNGGPGRVSRGLTQFATELEGAAGEDRFFALAEHNYLRPETKDYVPRLIAAALIGKQATRYEMSVDSQPEFVYDSVFVPAGTTLAAVAKASGSSDGALRDLNPFVLRGMAPPDGGVWMRVPTGRGESTAAALRSLVDADRVGFRAVGVTGSKTTMASVAAKHRLTARQMAWYNPSPRVGARGRLVAGQTIRIPTSAALAFARDVPDPAIERYGSAKPRRRVVAKRGSRVPMDARRRTTVAATSNRVAAKKTTSRPTAKATALTKGSATATAARTTKLAKGKSVAASAKRSTTAKPGTTAKSTRAAAAAKRSAAAKAPARKSVAKKTAAKR